MVTSSSLLTTEPFCLITHKNKDKYYPTIPRGEPRNYPSCGSAVLLPITSLQKPEGEARPVQCIFRPKVKFK
jgi:hypothetical protein